MHEEDYPPAPGSIPGVRDAEMLDALRLPWWWLGTIRRSTFEFCLLIGAGVLVAAALAFLIAIGRPDRALMLAEIAAGLAAAVMVVQALLGVSRIRSARRQVYMTDRAAIVLTPKRRRGELRWVAGEHIGRHKRDGYELRELMRPRLIDAADSAGATIWGRAATKGLARVYLKHLESWGLELVPGSLRRVQRLPAAARAGSERRAIFYAEGMEDGPEFAEGSYEFGGKTYRLAEEDSQVWRVFDGDRYLGIVVETDPTSEEKWPHYTAKCAGEEDADVPSTDDWRAALGHLIEASAL